MGYSVEGKIALITGAASGIGFEYAIALLRHGLKGVTIIDSDSKKGPEAAQSLNDRYGKKVAHFCRADVTKENELKSAFDTAFNVWKTLDIVINNAGVMKDGSWELQIAINCNAVVTGSLLALERMGKHRGGNGGIVVNIASILGLQELSGCPVYVGTKHFVLGMTRSFGQPYFYDKTGVKFLTMCPGVTDTPLITEASLFALTNYEGLGKLLAEQLASLPQQEPEYVAKGMYHLITHGENGSVWVCEGREPIYEVNIPDRLTLRKN
ncbi:15-hydroxyprostaglandin dehydrogenase [NAD(+)]-like [Coccinella septempunctata]|uniref:15-hydroxyprostaglandin dehydrogenase [NAD(+)]-like n=1 Tax=Coccinella septempunctata TaxID=41139 RepID=UPI001D095429|nr:15-hydroxyprostaglandin dehydrogenase [NAD(+)]-like [Coccinella septempunctata]